VNVRAAIPALFRAAPVALAVHALLCEQAWRAGRANIVTSRKTLAGQLGISLRSVARALSALKAQGWIRCKASARVNAQGNCFGKNLVIFIRVSATYGTSGRGSLIAVSATYGTSGKRIPIAVSATNGTSSHKRGDGVLAVPAAPPPEADLTDAQRIRLKGTPHA
jgi:hypothetical protein